MNDVYLSKNLKMLRIESLFSYILYCCYILSLTIKCFKIKKVYFNLNGKININGRSDHPPLYEVLPVLDSVVGGNNGMTGIL